MATLSALTCSSAPRLAAASTSTATLLGVNATGASQLSAATSQFGHMPIIRVYYAGVPTVSEWHTGATAINNSAVVLSFNPTPAQVLSGADDSALAQFFDQAPQGHAIYYSFYPEPEAHIRNNEFTFAQYKAAWARVVSIADAANNPYLHSTLILQGQDGRAGDEYDFKNYLPSGGVISTLGWDAYPDGTVDDVDPRALPPAEFMGPDIAASKSVGLPFGFAEFALGTSDGQAQWLTDVAHYLENQGALFGTLFDAAGFPWMVLHASSSIAAWRAAVAESAGAPAPPPPPPAPAPPSSAPTSPSASDSPSASSSPSASGAPSDSTTPAGDASGSGLHGRVTSPALAGGGRRRLAVTLPTISVTGSHRVRIRFRLSQAADVSICMLDSRGTVVSELDRRGLPAGWSATSYQADNQQNQPLPAGRYQAMVIASNASGTVSAPVGGFVVACHHGQNCVTAKAIN